MPFLICSGVASVGTALRNHNSATSLEPSKKRTDFGPSSFRMGSLSSLGGGVSIVLMAYLPSWAGTYDVTARTRNILAHLKDAIFDLPSLRNPACRFAPVLATGGRETTSGVFVISSSH